MFKVSIKSNLSAELFKKEIQEELEATANKVVSDLKEATPKDTGEAARNWKFTLENSSIIVSNDTEYIGQLNAGSSKQAPKNFIESTVLFYGKPKGAVVNYK